MTNFYSNNELDIDKFNKAFLDEQKEKEFKQDEEQLKRLESLGKELEKKQLHKMSLFDIIINFKIEIFAIINEIFNGKVNSLNAVLQILTKNNRLFYIGLLLIMVCICFFLISYILS